MTQNQGEKFINQYSNLMTKLLDIFVPSPPSETFFELYPLALDKIALLFSQLSYYAKKNLKLGLWIFEWTPVIWGFGFSRFSHMENELQKNYVDSWFHSKFWMKRYLIKSVKSLVMMSFLDQPRIWNYIGYDPHTQLKEKLELREKLLKQ